MNGEKVAKFMALAGQGVRKQFSPGTEELRALGAHLLLSEVLEYVIHGLGVLPEIGGVKVTDPEGVKYLAVNDPDQTAMLDGLADVAYTMNWNAHAFGVPLAAAYELVCDNNLEKFVLLGEWARGMQELPEAEWGCRSNVTWPTDVVRVEVVAYQGELYGVGKDARGKVRKPSTYRAVDLSSLAGSPRLKS